MKILMNVCDANGKYKNQLECICRMKINLGGGPPYNKDWNDVYIMVSESEYGNCWYSNKCNVRRLKKQFGEQDRNTK